jgi:hypothetical protein
VHALTLIFCDCSKVVNRLASLLRGLPPSTACVNATLYYTCPVGMCSPSTRIIPRLVTVMIQHKSAPSIYIISWPSAYRDKDARFRQQTTSVITGKSWLNIPDPWVRGPCRECYLLYVKVGVGSCVRSILIPRMVCIYVDWLIVVDDIILYTQIW